ASLERYLRRLVSCLFYQAYDGGGSFELNDTAAGANEQGRNIGAIQELHGYSWKNLQQNHRGVFANLSSAEEAIDQVRCFRKRLPGEHQRVDDPLQGRSHD